MNSPAQTQDLIQKVEALFEELIKHQQSKVIRTARMHIPHLTEDDILNPHDYPALLADPIFNYEEGLAAGLMAAQVAVRARILRNLESNPDAAQSVPLGFSELTQRQPENGSK